MPRLLCLGDSITDCGRLFSADPSWKRICEAFSPASFIMPAIDFSMENRGIDGFTLERLLQNMDSWLESL